MVVRGMTYTRRPGLWRWRLLAIIVAALVGTATLAGPSTPVVETGFGPTSVPWQSWNDSDDDDFEDEDHEFSADFEVLPSGYNPARDPGSPYNVARRIGLDDDDDGPTGAGVDIALIDTGVVAASGIRHSHVIFGPDFSFEDPYPNLRGLDSNGHGTHLAGIIIATDDDWADRDREREPDRVLGIAPDARLVSIKVATADGSVDVSQVIAAINWVIDNRQAGDLNIKVINLAYGTDGTQSYLTDPLAHAVERAWRAGIVVVVAAGNDGPDSRELRNPAADPYVIAVGAADGIVNGRLALSSFSNTGNAVRSIDIAAPGGSIVGFRNPGSYSDAYNEAGRIGGDLVRGSGTSQATAIVTGAVALVLEERPGLTPDQVKWILTRSADRPRRMASSETAGFLDIERALETRTPRYRQTWTPSNGSGSLEAARGSVHVVADGVPLTGEVDVFGADWSGSSWVSDSWQSNTWTGQAWGADMWTASRSWSGEPWIADPAGNEWSGNEWSGNEWSGNEWSGNEWSGSAWSGNEWSKDAWSTQVWQ